MTASITVMALVAFAALASIVVLIGAVMILREQSKHIKSTNKAINDLILGIIKLEKATDLVGITGVKEGFPRHIEAAWEDIGARGRFLTDLGGMSFKMREQLRYEVTKILYTPLTATPPAGSIADIMLDINRELTHLETHKDDVLVLVKTKSGVTQ